MLKENAATGTRTRVARVRAEYPNQLDYSGSVQRYPAPQLESEGQPSNPARSDDIPVRQYMLLGRAIHPHT